MLCAKAFGNFRSDSPARQFRVLDRRLDEVSFISIMSGLE
jgi:hypothetical protein